LMEGTCQKKERVGGGSGEAKNTPHSQARVKKKNTPSDDTKTKLESVTSWGGGVSGERMHYLEVTDARKRSKQRRRSKTNGVSKKAEGQNQDGK